MLARWNPWSELFDLEREMSDLTRRVFGSTWSGPQTRTGGNGHTWAPAVDVFTRGQDLVVRAELPGIDPEKDVDISFQDGLLTIRGERRHEEKSEQDNYYRVESTYGSFSRTIALPQTVKADDVHASYENGILEVVVPQAAQLSSAKKIPITSGSHRKALTAKGGKK